MPPLRKQTARLKKPNSNTPKFAPNLSQVRGLFLLCLRSNLGGNLGLLDGLKELVETHNGSTGLPCSAGAFLRQINQEEREAFENILQNRKVPIPNLVNLIEKNGYKIAKTALYKHRQKVCRCFN